MSAEIAGSNFSQVKQEAQKNASPQLDLSDVEPRVGKLVGGGQLWELPLD